MSKDLMKGTPVKGTKVFSSPNGVDLPLVRRKDGGTNYLRWKNHTVQRLAELYPSIYKEFSETALVETEAQAWARLNLLFPQQPLLSMDDLMLEYPLPLLENESTSVVPDAVFEQWVDHPSQARRSQAFTVAIEELRAERKAANVITMATYNGLLGAARNTRALINTERVAANKVATATVTAMVAEVVKKRDLRVSMASLLLGPKFISVDCLITIQSDGRFLLGEENSAWTIHSIVIDTLSQTPGPVSQQKLAARIAIQTMKQGSMRLDMFMTMFKEQRTTCDQLEVNIDEEELIQVFVGALNSEVFGNYKEEFYRDEAQYPATLNALFIHTNDYYVRKCHAFPSMANVLGVTPGYAVYAAYGYTDEDPLESAQPAIPMVGATEAGQAIEPPSERNPKPVCQLCDKVGHTAQTCFGFRDPETVKWYVEANAPQQGRGGGRGRSAAGRGRGPGVAAVSMDVPIVTPSVPEASGDYAAFCVGEAVTICSAVQEEGDDGIVDFEHDDHADVHVLRDAEATEFFETSEEVDCPLSGFASDIKVVASARGELILNMGTGVYVKNAKKNLLSAMQLRKCYDWEAVSRTDIMYVHRENGSTILFRLGSDGYFHTKLGRPDGYAVSSVDFYNPAPLTPVPPDNAVAIWSQIRSVERLHWASNHAGAARMKELISDPSYLGDVTEACIDLFYLHRGCSACHLGRMKHHSQLPSSRGLCQLVGQVCQGDFFFIESGATKIPVLLVIDEASLFTFMYAFVKGGQGAIVTGGHGGRVMCTQGQFKVAISAMLNVWARAGRTCRQLRFDREGLVVADAMSDWLECRGIRLVPTAADHKLGLIEVQGRIVKDESRAVVNGIRERFGYAFPKVYYPMLVGDVCGLLNRTCRGGRLMSAYRMMFGEDRGLDVRRDLRVAVGEIVLCHRPRTLVASIGVPKAQWGMVISRSYGGSGVFEVHLLENTHMPRVHRFKFVRAVMVPPHVMELARKMDLQHSVAPPPPVLPPDNTAAQVDEQEEAEGGEEMGVGNDGQADEEVVGPDAGRDEMLESVALVQISYSRGLKESPVRAAQAMRVECQGFLDQGLFHGRRYADVPVEDRPFILNSLSGYKDRIEQPTGKARVFIDGSKQLPELVGDAYSPVARSESTFLQLGLGARRGWRSVSYDVKRAFTLVRRPRKVRDHYRFVRLAKDIVKVLVELAPDMAEFVEPNGTMIVEMEYMLYGYVEAGKLWYEYLMGIYRAAGFTVSLADPCVIHYKSDAGEVHGSVTVDDTLFTFSSDAVLEEIEALYREAFGADGYTSEKGDDFMHLGMRVVQSLEDGSVAISQEAFVQELNKQAEPMIAKFGVKGGSTPSDPDIFDNDDDTPYLSQEDRDIYRSLTMSLMFASTRTYPETLVTATACASKMVHATEEDMRRLLKAIVYLESDKGRCLTIRPGSEVIVCSADCSYASHPEGYSHTGIALGFAGGGDIPDSFCAFASGKQTTVAKSSCHGELIAANVGGDYIVWARQLMEGFGGLGGPSKLVRNEKEREGSMDSDTAPSILRQDNKSTIHLIVMGRGSFRNSKHIRVRECFIRDMVRDGEIVVEWQHTSLMVADLLTKGVSRAVFEALLPALIGRRKGIAA